MKRAIQPKPGTWRGVQYRSQLEIAWAQWLEDMSPDHLRVEYQDQSAWDFVAYVGDDWAPRHRFGLYQANRIFIEVKPKVHELCRKAIDRFFRALCRHGTFFPGDKWVLVLGGPPNIYGDPMIILGKFRVMSHLSGPWAEEAVTLSVGLPDHTGKELAITHICTRYNSWNRDVRIWPLDWCRDEQYIHEELKDGESQEAEEITTLLTDYMRERHDCDCWAP